MLSAYRDQETAMAVLFSAIDNLGKGAAGQACKILTSCWDLTNTTGLLDEIDSLAQNRRTCVESSDGYASLAEA
jgi:hypothetical protein